MEDIFKAKCPLEEERLKAPLALPRFLQNITHVMAKEGKFLSEIRDASQVKAFFPNTYGQPLVQLESSEHLISSRPWTVGVVFSGGQAPGGHNVILGLFEGLKGLHEKSRLVGFLGGPHGIIESKWIELTSALLGEYRNTGGFDLIGSGRAKVESEEQLEASLKTVRALKLDALVVIGGDDSNTNAAVLAEFFLQKGCSTQVIGVPKTIDGDLKNAHIEVSFGFDTACKVYSEMIGNIARDALSAKKYYHFVKLMGRSASHIVLECALQTRPNLALIGEEIAAQKKTLHQITDDIVEMIYERAAQGKHYGVILIPEGLIEFVPEMKLLIQELNAVLAQGKCEDVEAKLSKRSKETFAFLPSEIRSQLLLERDSHGNVQVSKIATEQLLIHLVKEALKNKAGFQSKFNPVNHFLGYEGRSAFPSLFDAQYCYTLGHVAASLIQSGKTGYMAAIRGLANPIEEWRGEGVPLALLMNMEERKGKLKPVIQKVHVDLKGEPFKIFSSERQQWKREDHYRFPGPIQFFGPTSITQSIPLTLSLETSFERANNRR